MSRTTLGAGSFVRLTLAVSLAACGGSSELGLFGSGGAGGYRADAADDRAAGGASGAGGAAVEAGSAGAAGSTEDAAIPDVGPDRIAAEDVHLVDVGSTVDTGPRVDAGADADASSPRDAARDAIVGIDACRPTHRGVERCDGIDNDCNGRIDEGNACEPGCVGATHGGHGYMLCYAPMARASWQAAASACTGSDMHLVRVDDAAENAFLRATADSVNFAGAIWLGASDIMNERRWVWTDGTAFWTGGPGGMPVQNRYSNWANGEPNDGNRNVDCADMQEGAATWRDTRCMMREAYFCEE